MIIIIIVPPLASALPLSPCSSYSSFCFLITVFLPLLLRLLFSSSSSFASCSPVLVVVLLIVFRLLVRCRPPRPLLLLPLLLLILRFLLVYLLSLFVLFLVFLLFFLFPFLFRCSFCSSSFVFCFFSRKRQLLQQRWGVYTPLNHPSPLDRFKRTHTTIPSGPNLKQPEECHAGPLSYLNSERLPDGLWASG